MTTVLYTPPADSGHGPILSGDTRRHDTVIQGGYGPIPVTCPGGTTSSSTRLLVSWRSSTPYEVTFTFDETATTGREVQWRIGRYLLANGTHGPAGDITVNHHLWWVWIHLATDTGRASFPLDDFWLAAFLAATEQLVPTAYEWDAITIPDTIEGL